MVESTVARPMGAAMALPDEPQERAPGEPMRRSIHSHAGSRRAFRIARRGAAALVAFACFVSLPLLTSCAGRSAAPRVKPLRVAVAPFYPPIVFEQEGEIMGVEAELAADVGAQLGRPIEFVRMTRQELIPAVEDGEVDIAMSGISITPERASRVLFTKPYLRVGQLALIRIEDHVQLSGENALRKPGVRIGYVDGTTGEAYVTKKLGQAESYAFATVEAGVRSLRARRIDVFIHDAPTVWRIGTGMDERELMGLYTPLTDEALAWAVRKNRPELAAQLNELITTWRESGQLDRLLNRWIPVRVTVGSEVAR
jgi:polar amino acid transport system substrate-binding protein